MNDRPLAEIGGKALFIKEIEEALKDGRIDLAVHSLQGRADLSAGRASLAACLPREDPRDAFCRARAASLADVAARRVGRHVVAAAHRRRCCTRGPTSTIVPLRGNVDTRLKKLDDGAVDATILALAGLKRLGLADRATAILPIERNSAGAGAGRDRGRNSRRR